MRLLTWLGNALFQMLLPHGSTRCGLCSERHRDLEAHIWLDHAGDDCGVAG